MAVLNGREHVRLIEAGDTDVCGAWGGSIFHTQLRSAYTAGKSCVTYTKLGRNGDCKFCRPEHEDRRITGSVPAHPQKSLLALGEELYSLGLLAQVTSEVFHPMQAINGEPLTL